MKTNEINIGIGIGLVCTIIGCEVVMINQLGKVAKQLSNGITVFNTKVKTVDKRSFKDKFESIFKRNK